MRRPTSVLDKLRKSWLFAWIAAVVLALTHLKDAAEGYEKVLVLSGAKPDALAVASINERGAFAREFSEAAWRRIFWARAVVGRAQNGWKQEDVGEAYRHYLAATELWQTKLMTFIIYTEHFHGAAKAIDLEKLVVPAMNTLSEEVSAVKSPTQKSQTDFVRAHGAIDAANEATFYFVRGFSEKKRGT